MTVFSVDITDQALLDGIADAAKRYSATLPLGAPALDSAAYMDMLIKQAALSYASQLLHTALVDSVRDNVQAAVASAASGDAKALNDLNGTVAKK